MQKFNFIAIVLCFIIVVPGVFNGEWYETESPSLGNIPFTNTSNRVGNLVGIPGSDFVIFSNIEASTSDRLGSSTVIFDVTSGLFRGGCASEISKYYNVILPDSSGGWDIIYLYFAETERLGRQHIESSGEFGLEETFTLRAPYGSMESFGVLERGEAWFVANKILRFTSSDENWTEISYPEAWDLDHKTLNTYPAEDFMTLFVTSYGKGIEDYQCGVLDLVSLEFKMVEKEKGFFGDILDIKEWNGHDNSFLILKQDSLWLYDFNAGVIEKILEGFTSYSSSIFQNSAGENLYVLGPSPELFILHPEGKNFDQHSLAFGEGWNIETQYYYFDPGNDRIITFIQKGKDYRPLIIDLSDLSASSSENLSISEMNFCLYLPDEDKLLTLSAFTPYINVLDLSAETLNSSISITYAPFSWSIDQDEVRPVFIGNEGGFDFSRWEGFGRREFFDAGMTTDGIYHYMDRSAVLIKNVTFGGGTKLKEYHFSNEAIEDIELPYVSSLFLTDPLQNQIISLSSKDEDKKGVAMFIKPHGAIDQWMPGDEGVKYKTYVEDLENGAFWMICQHSESAAWYFYKVSTQSYGLMDSFTIDGNDMSAPFCITLDPSGKYLYFFNQNQGDDGKSSNELVVLDVINGEIVKKLTIQEDISGFKVTPCIIPIPGKDVLFLWAYDRGWTIDATTFDMIHGEVQQAPEAGYASPSIQGIWDEERDRVVVADLSKIVNIEGTYGGYLYEIDPLTCEVLEKIDPPDKFDINKMFFPEEKDRVVFLYSDKAKIHTLYIHPAWEEPAIIDTSTNYIQFDAGDPARFNIHVKNDAHFGQDVTAYIWLYAPGGEMIFFGAGGFSFDITGIPLSLPPDFDISVDIIDFTIPEGLPEGVYNFNAIFVNGNMELGPMGTWNFHV